MGLHVPRNRQCQPCLPTLRHFATHFAQMGKAILGHRGSRPSVAESSTTPQPKSQGNGGGSGHRLRLRSEARGARRIQIELRLHEQKEFSLATIHKVLSTANVKPLVKSRRPLLPTRYSRPIPGDRVQMDTMKIAPGAYQYTAVDDCSRFRVLGIYPRRNARNTLLFLDRLIEEMPFPIQRIQTDRGGEFFAEAVQRHLILNCIKFRPIPPRSPHLNGKVERSQLTDQVEFWSRHSSTEEGIEQRIEEWQFEYNWRRPHGSLDGKTPADRIAEIGERTPLSEEVIHAYDESKERIRHRDWRVDRTMAALHQRTSGGSL